MTMRISGNTYGAKEALKKFSSARFVSAEGEKYWTLSASAWEEMRRTMPETIKKYNLSAEKI